VSVELTYGLERIAMLLQKQDNVFDLLVGAGSEVPRRAAAGGD
jgi:glycyl-tRNA synthetase alpha subunit